LAASFSLVSVADHDRVHTAQRRIGS